MHSRCFSIDNSADISRFLPRGCARFQTQTQVLRSKANIYSLLLQNLYSCFSYSVSFITRDVSSNDMLCDCHVKWLLKLKKNKVSIKGTCAYPEPFKFNEIAKISPKNLQCGKISKSFALKGMKPVTVVQALGLSKSGHK